MTRTAGARNARHDERRAEFIARVRDRLSQAGATHASWRELAAAAGVSLSSMAHYFGKRDDVIRAVMAAELAQGTQPLAVLASPTGPFPRSVRDAVEHLGAGLSYGGLSRSFATDLVQCLRHPALGPAFLELSLEPTIRALEARLQQHIERGEMQGDARAGALMLMSPLLLAHLHQTELGGCETRALDLADFGKSVADAFVRAHSTTPQRPFG